MIKRFYYSFSVKGNKFVIDSTAYPIINVASHLNQIQLCSSVITNKPIIIDFPTKDAARIHYDCNLTAKYPPQTQNYYHDDMPSPDPLAQALLNDLI